MTTPEERDAAWERLRAERPWLPKLEDLHPPTPRPVPELGWCARCKRMDPRDDWVAGLDQYADPAGVICPDCLSPAERRKLDAAVLDLMVHGTTEDLNLYGVPAAIFINPEDEAVAP